MKRISKRKFKVFLRSFYLSGVIMFCILFAFFGVARAWENTVKIGFGQYKDAIEKTENGFRFLDFNIDL